MSHFGGTIKDATWEMCNWQHVFLSCLPPIHAYIQSLASRAQRTWESDFCPPLYSHLIILVFTLLGISGPVSFTVHLHCCISKTEKTGWELAQFVQLVRESGPKFRSLETMQKSGCCSAAVIPVLIPERGQRQSNPEIQLTRQSR